MADEGRMAKKGDSPSSQHGDRAASDDVRVPAADRHIIHHIYHRNSTSTTITTVSTMSVCMDDYSADYRLAYNQLVAQGVTDSEPSQIMTNVYIGSLLAASNVKHLRDTLHVTHILSIGSAPLVTGPFRYYHVDADDHKRNAIIPHFVHTNAFLDRAIQQANSAVLIHCHRGKSRSVTILLAFLASLYLSNPHSLHPLLQPIRDFVEPDDEPLWIGHMLRFVQSRRAKAFPNRGFYSQLMAFEDQLIAQHKTQCALPSCFIRDRSDNSDDDDESDGIDHGHKVASDSLESTSSSSPTSSSSSSTPSPRSQITE